MMIPLEFLFTVWLAATVASGIAAYVLYQRGRNSLTLTLINICIASVGMLSFYIANLFFDFHLQVMIVWSRWAISLMGLIILGGSIAAIILNKDKP